MAGTAAAGHVESLQGLGETLQGDCEQSSSIDYIVDGICCANAHSRRVAQQLYHSLQYPQGQGELGKPQLHCDVCQNDRQKDFAYPIHQGFSHGIKQFTHESLVDHQALDVQWMVA